MAQFARHMHCSPNVCSLYSATQWPTQRATVTSQNNDVNCSIHIRANYLYYFISIFILRLHNNVRKLARPRAPSIDDCVITGELKSRIYTTIINVT